MSSRPCELSERDRESYDKAKAEAEMLKAERVAKDIANTERLAVLRDRPDLLAEVDEMILRNRLHKALMTMAIESVESGKVQVNTVEDLEILLYLNLLVTE